MNELAKDQIIFSPMKFVSIKFKLKYIHFKIFQIKKTINCYEI